MLTRLNGFEQSLPKDFIYFENEMERLLEVTGIGGLRNQSRKAGQPSLNVTATTEQVDIYLAIAGIDPEAVDISLNKNQMHICGNRFEERKEELTAIKKERFSGEFNYLVTLPDDIEPEGVEAN